MKSSPLFLSSALLTLAGVASADTIQVPRDYSTIQAAVTAAQTGDVIDVRAGYYRENVTVTTAGLTLKGRHVILDGAYLGTCLDVQANDVTVSGFKFVNGGTASTTGFVAAGGGLNVVGNGASILNCEASGCTSFGIKLLGNGEIAGCDISAVMGPGLVVDTGNQIGERILLTANAVERCAAGILADNGPFVITRNIAVNNTGNGFELNFLAAAGGTTPSASTLSRNRSVGNGGAGLVLVDEIGAVHLIEKSAFEGNDVGLDISAKALAISGNDINFNRSGGAFLKTTNATLDSNTVRRNTLCGVLVASYNSELDGFNKLLRNSFEANGGDGIHVNSGSNLVEANTFRNNKGDGLQVATGAVGNSLINNTVHDSGNDGIDNWGTATSIRFNKSEGNFGADLAGYGDGNGTTDANSSGNVQGDDSGLTTKQELELDTLTP